MILKHKPWAEAPPGFRIGLRPIDDEHWLEGGETQVERKIAVRAAHPRLAWGELEGSRPAQAEVLALVAQATGQAAPAGEPLWAASLMVADDLCLMEKREAGWTLTAASLCSPTFFSVEESLGKALRDLHGPVPGFNVDFLWRVERMFGNLPQGRILERNNWTLLNSDEYFLPTSAGIRAKVRDIHPAQAGETLFVRVERQTLRRLRGGGLLFTIRIWRDPLSALRRDPVLLEAFARAWREAPDDFRTYKGLARYDHLVEAFLAD